MPALFAPAQRRPAALRSAAQLVGIVDTQAAKADAAGLAVIRVGRRSDVPGIKPSRGVLDGELAATTPTAQQTGQQRRTVLGRPWEAV